MRTLFTISIIVSSLSLCLGKSPVQSEIRINQFYIGGSLGSGTQSSSYFSFITQFNLTNNWGLGFSANSYNRPAINKPPNYSPGGFNFFRDFSSFDLFKTYTFTATKSFLKPDGKGRVFLEAGPSYVEYFEAQYTYNPGSGSWLDFGPSHNMNRVTKTTIGFMAGVRGEVALSKWFGLHLHLKFEQSEYHSFFGAQGGVLIGLLR